MIGGSQGSPAGHGRVDPRSRDPRTLSAASPVGFEPVGLDADGPGVREPQAATVARHKAKTAKTVPRITRLMLRAPNSIEAGAVPASVDCFPLSEDYGPKKVITLVIRFAFCVAVPYSSSGKARNTTL